MLILRLFIKIIKFILTFYMYNLRADCIITYIISLIKLNFRIIYLKIQIQKKIF